MKAGRAARIPSPGPNSIVESVSPSELYARQARDVVAEIERDRPADDEEWLLTTGVLRALIAGGGR